MPEPIEVEEGKTYAITPGVFIREECCECGTCHLTQYVVDGDHIRAVTFIDPYGTRKARARRIIE
jgi:hypothetical protein